jgi:hypothetical protein
MASRIFQTRCFSDKRNIELRTAGGFGILVLTAELSGEGTAGPGAPHQQPSPFSFEERHYFALEAAQGVGVVSL